MWWQASFGMVAWHSWQIKHDKAWNFTTVYTLLDFFPAGIVQVWNYWGVVIYWNLNQRFDRCSTSLPIIEWIYQRQGPKGINRMCVFGEHMLEATFLGAISITFKMQWRSLKTTQLTPEWPISKAGPR